MIRINIIDVSSVYGAQEAWRRRGDYDMHHMSYVDAQNLVSADAFSLTAFLHLLTKYFL